MSRRLLAAAVVAPVLAACDRNPSVLNPQGPRAEEAAYLFWLMLALATPVMALVIALVLGSARRRRDGDMAVPPERTAHAHGRSIAWIVAGGIVLPVVVIVPLSILTLFALNRVDAPPEDPLVVEVEGHQFWWEVRYPGTGAVTANEVHVPVGRDVEFVLTTADVIHSFWVANLGGKRDMIPGETTTIVYRAETPGVWEGVCAEFCGVQHAWMRLLVVAQPPEEFEAWLEHQAADAVAPTTQTQIAGQRVFQEAGCAGCHRIRGTAAAGRLGPDLTHFADRRSLGAVVAANNPGNLGGWIANPHGLKPGVNMPPAPVTGAELNALIDYLESLR